MAMDIQPTCEAYHGTNQKRPDFQNLFSHGVDLVSYGARIIAEKMETRPHSRHRTISYRGYQSHGVSLKCYNEGTKHV